MSFNLGNLSGLASKATETLSSVSGSVPENLKPAVEQLQGVLTKLGGAGGNAAEGGEATKEAVSHKSMP